MTPPPVGQPGRRRLSRPSWVAVLVAVVLMTGLGVLLVTRDDDAGRTPGRDRAAPPPAARVVARQLSYGDARRSARVGEEVRFDNRDSTAHTFTADDGQFDSRVVPPGGHFAYTFPRPGTFPFHCEIHPSMRGVVEVSP